MKAYISVSYSQRQHLDKELITIVETLSAYQVEPFVFVDHYKFDATEEKQMMMRATAHIDSCDFLLAETTGKGIGVGVEAGYAKAKRKPVVYVRQLQAEHSTTVSGISDFEIIYENTHELEEQLKGIISEIKNILT